MSGKITSIAAFLLILLLSSISHAASRHQVVAIKSADIAPYNEAVEGFRKACNCNVSEISLSEMEGRNLRQRVLDQDPELIFTVGSDALSQAAVFRDLPVVYSMVLGTNLPEGQGRSLSGVNMHISPERYLNSIAELFPSVRRIGLVYDPRHSGLFAREAEQFARNRGLELVTARVSEAGEVLAAVDGLAGRIDVLWMVPDLTVVNSTTFKHMLSFSYMNRVPVFTFTRKYVEMGAAAGLHAVPYDIGAQAAEIARRILAGDSSRLPIRANVRRAELIVNEKIIQKLGTRHDDAVLGRAANVQ